MLKNLSFMILGQPINLLRYRYKAQEKKPEKLASKKSMTKKLIKRSIIEQNLPVFYESVDSGFDKPLLNGPLELTAKFYMDTPMNHKLRAKKGLYHICYPNIHDLLTFICDVMSGIVYKKQAEIYKIETIKCYSQRPRTEIHIEEVMLPPLPQEMHDEKSYQKKRFQPAIRQKAPIY